MSNFYYAYEEICGKRAVVLGYRAPEDPNQDLQVKVAPELGNNLYCFKIGAHEIVHYDEQFALTSYCTGNPILYPIPNRCENCRYTFEGKGYWQQKNHVPVFLHSLVYDEAWGYRTPVVTDTDVCLETYLKIDETHPVYQGFPFPHTITITYRLTERGLEMTHHVQNEGEQNLPFGLSYHTYFSKLSGDNESLLQISAPYTMELTDALLPTGKLLDVADQPFDLRTPVSVGSLDLDTCFTDTGQSVQAVVDYTTLGLQIQIGGTEDFTHVQVYTPQGKPFFCVEMQTCSTDVINLATKGYTREAHLLVVRPGETRTGTLHFRYKKV